MYNFPHVSKLRQYINMISDVLPFYLLFFEGSDESIGLPGEVVESVALNRVSSALRAVLQLQQVHTVHLVDGKAFPVADL